MPLWRQPSPICRVMLNALIPNGIDRRGARNWVSNPALRTMTESSLQRPLKYLPMITSKCPPAYRGFASRGKRGEETVTPKDGREGKPYPQPTVTRESEPFIACL